MKKLKVCGFSALMDAEMNPNDADQASDLFETMMNSEVYCYFNTEVDGNGIKTTYWTAFA